jgi:flagellar M-ring protein FliF
MNEQLQMYRAKVMDLYHSFSTKQKWMIAATFLFLVISLSIFVYFASKPEYIPLFSNSLSQQEIGEVKAQLDSKNYKTYQLSDDGKNILVPKKDAASLSVDLAAAGLPKGGNISLDIFSQNMGFGTTDRQFDVVERDAMQNEIAKVIKGFSGVSDASVVITLPKEQLFVGDDNKQTATASILVNLQPGTQLSQKQINTLYHFVSKTIPNLPEDNIVITDQYSQMLQRVDDSDVADSGLTQYEEQRKIKQQVESDIQRNLQNMLGTIIGRDKVFVYPYVKLNFDKVKSKEQLVEPVDKENNQGIDISVEKIQKTFNGTSTDPSGVAGTANGQVPNTTYPGNAASNGKSQSDSIEQRVNREVNRISKDIVESPYVIEDMTINVGIEPPNPQDPTSLGTTNQEVQKILSNVVRAALEKDSTQPLTQQYINDRISVFARPFAGKQTVPQAPQGIGGNNLLYSVGGAAALAAIGLGYFLVRRRKSKAQEEAEDLPPTVDTDVPDLEYVNDSPEMVARKQLERLAKQRPEEFASLLRTWLQEE